MEAVSIKEWRKMGPQVFVTCPTCGLVAGLDHDIDTDGNVNPSLDCPQCPFHEMVVLEGWTAEEGD